MWGLEKEETRDSVGFVVKTGITVVGAFLALLFGTAHLAKIDQEQLLRAKLTGDTNFSGPVYGPYESEDGSDRFCFVRGSYRVLNTGQYPFVVDSVTIELWRLPFITEDRLDPGGAISYSLSERLSGESANPAERVGDRVVIEVGEQFGVNNELQRSFGFIVAVSEAQRATPSRFRDSYVVVANAYARIDDRGPWYDGIARRISGDLGLGFLENDLRHVSGTFDICHGLQAQG